MKKLNLLFVFAIGALILPGCATIIGGSKYYANVKVEDYPDAKIYYNGMYQGAGEAEILVPRPKANQFSVQISKAGCKSETFEFTQRKFRGWACFGTIVGWTGVIATSSGAYIPLPWGITTDLITGALWKPDENEQGVTKVDYKQYNYLIDYKGCEK